MNTLILDRLDWLQEWVRRRRWWIRLATAAVLLPCLSWFVYTRMTTMPPGAGVLSGDEAFRVTAVPPGARTQELVNAFESLPALPMLVPPALSSGWQPVSGSGGWGWSSGQLDPSEALRGDWKPAERFHLSKIVLYLKDAKTQKALADIAALAGEPAVLPQVLPGGSRGLSGSTQSRGWFGYLQSVTEMLLARARGRLAEKQNFDAAYADLRTALQLAANLEDDGRPVRIYCANQCRCLIMEEMVHWSREFPFSAEQIRSLQQLLEQYRLDWRAAWSRAIRGEAAFYESMLDRCYTKDASGNGWPVICLRNPAERWNLPLRTLNVLTFALNDRRTMQGKVQGSVQRLDQMMDVPSSELYENQMRQGWFGNLTPADFMLAECHREFVSLYCQCLDSPVRQQATATCLALAAYKLDHGCYPDRLEQLVGAYMPAMPADPFSGRPMTYRPDMKYGYVLSSVGVDGKDNADAMLASQHGYWGEYGYGLLFCMPRQTPRNEWIPVPGSSPATAAATASSPVTGNRNDDSQGQ